MKYTYSDVLNATQLLPRSERILKRSELGEKFGNSGQSGLKQACLRNPDRVLTLDKKKHFVEFLQDNNITNETLLNIGVEVTGIELYTGVKILKDSILECNSKEDLEEIVSKLSNLLKMGEAKLVQLEVINNL